MSSCLMWTLSRVRLGPPWRSSSSVQLHYGMAEWTDQSDEETIFPTYLFTAQRHRQGMGLQCTLVSSPLRRARTSNSRGQRSETKEGSQKKKARDDEASGSPCHECDASPQFIYQNAHTHVHLSVLITSGNLSWLYSFFWNISIHDG